MADAFDLHLQPNLVGEIVLGTGIAHAVDMVAAGRGNLIVIRPKQNVSQKQVTLQHQAFFVALVAVVGPVGSGKSSLLASILNEMHCSKGSVQVSGSVAYAAQTANMR